MPFSFIKKKTSPLLGVDISSNSVKVVELSQSGHRYRVDGYAIQALPEGAVADRELNDVEAVAEAVRQAVRAARARHTEVALAVSASQVITKIIEMPSALTEDELMSQIELEADRYIPYPLEEVSLDFQILGPSARHPDMSEILLAASRTENVDVRLDALAIAGLKAKVVDVEPYAVERAMSLVVPPPEPGGKDSVFAVIDIGDDVLMLAIYQGRRTIYTREQSFGGAGLLDDVQRRYGMTREDAKLRVRTGDMPDDYLAVVLRPFVEAIVDQIQRALQLFMSSPLTREIEHLFLSGGVANINGLATYVGQQLGKPTKTANPFANMLLNSKIRSDALSADASSLVVPCGLALRSFLP